MLTLRRTTLFALAAAGALAVCGGISRAMAAAAQPIVYALASFMHELHAPKHVKLLMAMPMVLVAMALMQARQYAKRLMKKRISQWPHRYGYCPA